MEIGAKKARQHFAELLRRAEQGEEIVLTRCSVPVAKLVPARTRTALNPDALAAFRSSLETPADLPNSVLQARREAKY